MSIIEGSCAKGFPSSCWHALFTLSVVLVFSFVGIDSSKGTKCMFETVFDLSAGGIIIQKTLLHLSGSVLSYTLGKQLLSGPV